MSCLMFLSSCAPSQLMRNLWTYRDANINTYVTMRMPDSTVSPSGSLPMM